ncbi:unnamed protein product, partial [Polarella glacialis]
ACECGEGYCSEGCRSAADVGHRALCAAALPIEKAQALRSLRSLLQELPNVCEAFEAVLLLLAAATAGSKTPQIPGAPEQEPESGQVPTGPRLWSLVQGLAGAPWWETLSLPPPMVSEAQAITASVLEFIQAVLSEEELVGDLSVGDLAMLVGQVRMNAVEAIVPPAEADAQGEQLQPAEGLALHLVASTVNHACEPNCALQSGLALAEIRGWAVLQALRPLAEGEEVSIEYVGRGADRHDELLEQWGFDCACRHCG